MFAARLFRNRSKMTSKCGKNKEHLQHSFIQDASYPPPEIFMLKAPNWKYISITKPYETETCLRKLRNTLNNFTFWTNFWFFKERKWLYWNAIGNYKIWVNRKSFKIVWLFSLCFLHLLYLLVIMIFPRFLFFPSISF